MRAAGGSAEAPTEKPWGRSADCIDNQGTAFSVFAPRADNPGERPPVNGARPGDVCYLTYSVRDSALAREFYGSVLGWTFAGAPWVAEPSSVTLRSDGTLRVRGTHLKVDAE